MRLLPLLGVMLAVASLPQAGRAQGKRSEEEFVKDKPTVGEILPDVTAYSPDGKEVKTSSLRGHYTVLTFGCLT